MSALLRIRAAGPGVTLQDPGRFGLARYGVTPAGPMDEGAYLAATRAVGAKAAIEVSLGGAVFEAEGAALSLAIAGGAFDLQLDDHALPAACVLALAPGSRLALRAGAGEPFWGAWCYVAVGGAFELAPMLGSRASHTRSGLGIKPLGAGDALPLRDLAAPPAQTMSLAAPWLLRNEAPIRVLLGPQDDYFLPAAIETFLAAEWRLGARSDRMAYALEGPRVNYARGHDIISDGVAFGAIQIPGSGGPFVLMADRQPTGGYPKIATVIGADLGRLAQKRPGDALRFCAVSWEEAVAARRAFYEALDAGAQTAPIASDLANALLFENLVGGVISARE